MRTFAVIAMLALICVGIFVATLTAQYVSSKPERIVRPGTPIRQDDFVYTVVSVRKAQALTFHHRLFKASGSFYLVTVRLDNHAIRVPFDWRNDIVQVIDAEHRSFLAAPQIQPTLDADRPTDEVAAGASELFQVAFDVPRDSQHPTLVFRNGIFMGDVFDLAAYRRIGVAIQ